MNKPFKYAIHDTKDNSWSYTNIEPLKHHLETWEDTENPQIKIKKQTKNCYIDTRYKAKLRLYNYITYTKNGLEIPRYQPYKGYEGAILNF